MNNKMILATVAVAAIVVVLIASFVVYGTDKEDPKEPTIVDEWDLVTAYIGGWNDGKIIYYEDTTVHGAVKIEHYKGDFYTMGDGSDRLYGAWDGEKLISAESEYSTTIVMLDANNSNFLEVMYFDEFGAAIIEVYERQGYVGDFPGLKVPFDLPEDGTVMESYKNREYTPDGNKDHGTNTLTARGVHGPIFFYDVLMGDDLYYFTCIYIDHRIFMSLGVCGDSYIFDMTEYRGDVLYCSSKDLGASSTWVTEYGDKSKKDYPDFDLSKRTYSGTEDFVIFKDGKIVEQKYGNKMNIRVIDQEDQCLYISATDEDGDESAMWSMVINDLRPTYHYGLSVQSVIEYNGVDYVGQYYGHFTSAKCDELVVYGTLVSESGSYIVISQTYKVN